jgi:hypothetical protein
MAKQLIKASVIFERKLRSPKDSKIITSTTTREFSFTSEDNLPAVEATIKKRAAEEKLIGWEIKQFTGVPQ